MAIVETSIPFHMQVVNKKGYTHFHYSHILELTFVIRHDYFIVPIII